MSEIYKVNRVINNEISHIYVFGGDRDITEKDYKNIFSAKELKNIKDKNIPVQIIGSYIYGDDTIQRIKEKIFKECNNINNSIPKAMYLFSITEKKYNSDILFYNLTQDDTIELTDNRLKQFLSNIVTINKITNKKLSTFFKDIVIEDKYNYNDFNHLNINWNSKISITKSIGQKLVIKNNYPFIANPFNNKIIDDFLKRSVENIISTQNAYLLFKYFPIKNNNIYLSLAEDVLNYADNNGLDQGYFFKLYYPLLYKDIKTKNELIEQKLTLYNTEKSRINKYYKKINERIDIFYNIWSNNPEPLKYTSTGISYIHLTLHPENSIKLPLEVLFKIIHSTSSIPLIKYNPGVNYENIYRLFTDNNISLSGIKIPSLFILNNNRKTKIINISKILSRRQSVGFYIEHLFKQQVIEIYCEFYENGSIEIKFSSELLLDILDIQRIIKKTIDNTILNIVRNYLKQSGYTYIKFNNIIDENVEINNLTYETVLKNKKSFNINKYIGCISALFNVISGSASKTTDVVELVYKRVNVFQLMDSIKGFITNRRQNGDEVRDLIPVLMENFPKEIPTADRALELIVEWQQEVDFMIETRGEGKKVIKSNPGFPTTITSKVFTRDTFSILKIENINDIRYLDYIKIYINSLFRIILKTGLKEELKEKINKICRKKIDQQDNVDVVKDIQADTEKRGAIQFGEKKELDFDDVEEDSDEDDLTDISEDEDEDEDVLAIEFDDNEIEFGEDAIEPGEDAIEPGEDAIETGDVEIGDKVTSTPTPSDDEISLIDSDEEVDLSDDDSPLNGGGKNDSDDDDELEEDLTHLALSGAKSIFTKRLKENDPVLFLKKDTPGYASYTRSCPNQYRRQPVLITDEEKEYIDSEDKKKGISSYGESIRYGSGDKKFNYICPRFWCIKDPNTGKPRSLTLQQVNDGECGGWDAIIPEKAKKVPKGKRIVEFTDERFHRENSGIPSGDPARKLIYRPMYPGFQHPSKHPEKKCIPCCFQSPFKKEKYMGWEEGKDIPFMFKKIGSKLPPEDYLNDDGTINLKVLEDKKYNDFRRQKEPASEYLCNNEGTNTNKVRHSKEFDDTPIFSFPLRKNQFGYMNDSLQKFLGFNNNICYKSAADRGKLATQQYCIIRLGIHKNKNQSFIELLGSVYNYYSSMKILPDDKKLDLNLTEIKEIFLNKLTVDKFVMAQNGILPKLFEKKMDDIDFSKYKTSKYLNKITDESYKIKIISSYENFKNYINSKTEKIDYKYIWDFVSKPINQGGVLFENGINLLILRNPDDDITNKIELICPTNHYSHEFFDIEKKTLMIYNKGDYFEPLCKIFYRDKKYQTIKFFSRRDYRVFADKSSIMDIINKIKDILTTNCVAKTSLKKYDYQRNISSKELINIINEINYRFIAQIMNYNNNVIGIIVSNGKKSYYIPCRPSSVLIDKEFIFSEEAPINSYEETKMFLKTLYNKSNKRIPCDIKEKLIDDNMIVGIKTITNQIIPVVPISKVDGIDDIKEDQIYSGNNILTTDYNVIINKSVDEERDKIVKSLELENNFYNLFRNTLKIILNDKSNIENRTKILDIAESPTFTYIEKMEKIRALLQTLLANAVSFDTEFVLDSLDDYNDMITCLGLDEDDCTSGKKYCSFMRQNTCVLTLPKINLYNNADNKGIYYNKLTDEIIRYSKIRNYLFTSREFLSFEHVNYRINENEIILLEEILMDTYFDDLELREDNEYINSTNIYDIVNPLKGIKYSSTYQEDICSMKSNFSDAAMKGLSNNNTGFKIEQSRPTEICCFNFILQIINEELEEEVSIDYIKQILIDEYLKIKTPSTKLILNKENVSNWSAFSIISWLQDNKYSAESVINKPEDEKAEEIKVQINKETYTPTELDLFLIFNALNIPSIITMKPPQTIQINSSTNTFNTFDKKATEIYIIIVTKYKKIKMRSFSIAKLNDLNKIPKSLINDNLLSGINNMDNFLIDSLNNEINKKEKIRKQNKKAQQKKRKGVINKKNVKKTSKLKVKKLSVKKKLPSK